MKKIDIEILDIDKVICKNIETFDDSERGLLSQNILSQLRNFIEHISLKIYAGGNDIEDSYENIGKANDYVKSKGNLKFLSQFHRLLKQSASHYTLNEENSERLMLKYYEYLLRIKSLLKKNYNLDVLVNITLFPIVIDTNLKEYYEKIAIRVDKIHWSNTIHTYNDRYYIQKIKPFFVEHKIYYEVTFTIANDKASKFDRVIAFTSLDIPYNYAVKLSIKNDNINIFGKNMPILIIYDYEVSMRPCEIKNFSKIFGYEIDLTSGSVEYRELMKFLTTSRMNLVEIAECNNNNYLDIKNQIIEKVKIPQFFKVLDEGRKLIENNEPGSNVIRYLLYRLNNKIIKKQYKILYWDNQRNEYFKKSCDKLSNLYIDYGCIPFDQMPFNTSLKSHNPKIIDLFDCIDSKNREHELFARFIKNNTENNGQIYLPKKEIVGFNYTDKLIETYNSALISKHENRRLVSYKEYIYIKDYDESTYEIIKQLIKLTTSGIKNYSNSVHSWLQSSSYNIDCDEKKSALIQLFENSRVAFIYGAAGTGKSTLINHISNFFHDKQKFYLANSNPAVDNLKRRVSSSNCFFNTVAKFLSIKNKNNDCDVLFIDECSTISNLDMLSILKKATFKLLVLVGDIFQIESIIFGNWFDVSRKLIPHSSIYELTKPYRSNKPNLLILWERVRTMDEAILECIAKNNYSKTLDETIFKMTEDDEIILCLNYDGLYGINNINRFLQNNNSNVQVEWGIHIFKVGDPILFNESERFAPLIYNNLKGKIIEIISHDKKIQFDIEIYMTINQLDAYNYDFELVGNSLNGNSIIRFYINNYETIDNDDDSLSSESIIPFQIAYAVSIHKAQGLEYNSVKIVITNEIEEMITHNIFYTAITRAKENLSIYWTPETEKKVLDSLKIKNNSRDIAIFKTKFNL